jgi:hypothetical protein
MRETMSPLEFLANIKKNATILRMLATAEMPMNVNPS